MVCIIARGLTRAMQVLQLAQPFVELVRAVRNGHKNKADIIRTRLSFYTIRTIPSDVYSSNIGYFDLRSPRNPRRSQRAQY